MSKLTPLILTLSLILICPSCRHVPPTPTPPKDPIILAQRAFLFIEIQHGKLCKGKENCTPKFSGISGSGFLVEYDNEGGMFAITAAHSCKSPYVDGISLIEATSYDGVKRDAYVVKSVPEFDICILHIPKINHPVLTISQEPPRVGDAVFTVSAPLGVFSAGALLMFKGYYSGLLSENIAGYTVPTAPGSSGSPILNQEGKVIGMTSAKMKRFENFCISPRYELVEAIYKALYNVKLDSSSGL